MDTYEPLKPRLIVHRLRKNFSLTVSREKRCWAHENELLD